MKVDTHIGGSKVVVWVNRAVYIDARKDVRYPGMSFIEVVRNGQVVQAESVPDTKQRSYEKDAPETIIGLIRDWS